MKRKKPIAGYIVINGQAPLLAVPGYKLKRRTRMRSIPILLHGGGACTIFRTRVQAKTIIRNTVAYATREGLNWEHDHRVFKVVRYKR